jgi:hypothetical protein
MNIGLQAHAHVTGLDLVAVVFGHAGEHVGKNSEILDAHNLALVEERTLLMLVSKPLVRYDLAEAVAQIRIWHQYVFNKTLRLTRQLTGNLVASVKNLLVKTLRIRIFERQVAAQQRVQNDACAPDVSLLTYIFEAFNQLWCCVAGGPACG